MAAKAGRPDLLRYSIRGVLIVGPVDCDGYDTDVLDSSRELVAAMRLALI